MLRKLLLLSLVLLSFHELSAKKPSQSLGIEKKGGIAIVVNFPEKPIPIPLYPSFWNFWAHIFDFDRDECVKVGHTGVILVCEQTGNLTYYDFGRYDDRNDLMGPRPAFYGTVRSPRTVPDLELKLKARIEKGAITNLDTILVHLAAKKLFRTYGAIEAAVAYNLNLSRMHAKAKAYEAREYIFYGAPTHLYCTRFVRDVIRAGGGAFSIISLTGTQTVKDLHRKGGTVLLIP